jgi:hypothetical protein
MYILGTPARKRARAGGRSALSARQMAAAMRPVTAGLAAEREEA